MAKDTVAIIGAGNMGIALGKRLAAAGYAVVFDARDAAKGAKTAAALGENITGGGIGDAAAAAPVVVLAVPYGAAADALKTAGPIDGKVLVDVSNPFTPDLEGLLLGHTTSAPEEIQKLAPTAKVVKAFHLFFATRFEEGVYFGDTKFKAFYACDDEAAGDTVAAMASAIGLEPANAGPLRLARTLEPLALLSSCRWATTASAKPKPPPLDVLGAA